jgi:hypothetical protein
MWCAACSALQVLTCVLVPMQFATEAAITILRIDDMLTIQKGPNDDADD